MDPDNIIFQTARAGTATNPGLPATLANLLIAQAKHETGNYTSRFFTQYNNAFGYSYAGSKYQTGPGPTADNGQPIGVYGSLADSVREIVDWIYRRVREGKFPADLSTIQTPEQYAALLKSAGYYGDTLANYTRGLKNFFLNLYQEIEKPAGIVTLAVIGVLVYFALQRKK